MKVAVFVVHLYGGARDNDIDAAKAFDGCRDRGSDLAWIGHVSRKCEGFVAAFSEFLST